MTTQKKIVSLQYSFYSFLAACLLSSACTVVPDELDPEIGSLENRSAQLANTKNILASDPYKEKQWHLQKVGAEVVAQNNLLALSPREVVVAVIDSGIDYGHEDLRDNLWVNLSELGGGKENNGKDDDKNGYVDDLIGYDFINEDNRPYDLNGHGTFVSGLIAANRDNGIGVAGFSNKIKIMSLQTIQKNGSGNYFDAISAMEYAVKNGAEVIYLNWVKELAAEEAKALDKFIRGLALENPRIVIVTSSGSEGVNVDYTPQGPVAVDLDNFIKISATDESDGFYFLSNFGRNLVTISAPGVRLFSSLPNNTYGYRSGTDFAAAVAAGGVALLKSVAPHERYEIRQRLVETAHLIPADASRNLASGRMDILKASQF